MENKNLVAKIFALQSEVGAIAKSETNPFYKSKYFDINALIEHLAPLLQKHGLVITQPLTHIEGKPAIATVIQDSDSGEAQLFITPLPHIEDPQKMGSAITYHRRYSLQSFLLLQAEDDDANLTKPAKVAPQVKLDAPAAEQVKKIKELKFLLSITNEDMPANKKIADQWIKAYEAKLAEQK